MPGTPTEQSPGAGVHNFQVTRGDQSWVASFVILTGEMKQKPAQEVLDETRSAFLSLLPSSKLLSSATWSIGGFPGVSCVIESQVAGRPSFRLKMNALVTPDRLFTFGFACRREDFVETQADRYLSTFRLR
jgi:hypothetical protein